MIEYDALNALDTCIDHLSAGRSVESCVQDFPEVASELKPLLVLATAIAPALGSRQEIENARQHVFSRLEREFAQPVSQGLSRASMRWLRYAVPIAAIVMLAFVTTGLLAQESLPGDFLYSTKRFTEALGLVLTGNSPGLQESIMQRRIDETRDLIRLHREAQVDFTGLVEQVSDAEIVVAGLSIQIGPEVPRTERLYTGDLVEVEAETTNHGQLAMQRFQLLNRPEAPRVEQPYTTSTDLPTSSPGPTSTINAPRTPAAGGGSKSHTATTQPVMKSPQTAPTSAGHCEMLRPSDWYRYEVQAGDSLSSLAIRVDMSVDELIRANCIDNPSLIIVGQEIYLPQQPRPRDGRLSEFDSAPEGNGYGETDLGNSGESGGTSENKGPHGDGNPEQNTGNMTSNGSQDQKQQGNNKSDRPG